MNYLFGLNPVLEALRAHPETVERLYLAEGALGPRVAGELLSRAGERKIRVDRVDRERLSRLAEGGVHQGVVAEVKDFEYLELEALIALAADGERPPLLVLLDGIQDPHNLGAIVRSAHALGAHGVVLTKDRAASVTPAVVKASAGAVSHTPIARVTNLSRAIEALKAAGYWTVALDPSGDREPWAARLDGPLAVIVGAEGAGVRKGVLGHCDFRLRIPMLGQVDSLNASVSAGVLLYEIARQRQGRPNSP
jgi:23S rRNA (guanosine2251-2'-O)-methyltransferase